MNVELHEAWRLLQNADNVLLLTHRLPDGDALGSLGAMYYVLKQLNKNVTFLLDTVPANLQKYTPVAPETSFDIQTVITVDVGDKKLLGNEWEKQYGERVFLNIDHHSTNEPFARYTLCNPKAAAACEVMYDLLTEADFTVTPQVANCLYLGIATDTGCFRYTNTTPKTLRTAAFLMEAGAQAYRMITEIFETKSKQMLKFESDAMAAITLYHDGKIAVMVITQEMYQSAGIREADDKSINGLPRQIEGVLVGITVKEKKDGGYRVSMRSNEPISASDICVRLGGGGHRLAAGCEPEGDLQQVCSSILNAVEAVFAENGVE